ncbi:MAG TPA: ABC transporter ATP-binding protein [Dehalococcoidales bacterium]|nr:ABC transporter ATP-binding protein [Dehalococcoidales bacterium]
MNGNIITAEKLTKTYRRGNEKLYALNEIDLEIASGEFAAIVGPSGSGKTTLLNMLGCLDTPDAGSLRINSVSVSNLKERERGKLRREIMGFVFQQFYLLPTLSVRENIELPFLFNRQSGYKETVDKIIETIGLTARVMHLPHQLSGGEMQRVAIGRALVNQPRILLADEPTGNLDSGTARNIIQLLQRLNGQGLTIIVVTHNEALANLAHRIIPLKDGKIV